MFLTESPVPVHANIIGPYNRTVEVTPIPPAVEELASWISSYNIFLQSQSTSDVINKTVPASEIRPAV